MAVSKKVTDFTHSPDIGLTVPPVSFMSENQKNMHPVLASLIAATWLFFSGALVFAVALPRWFQSNFGHLARDPKESPRFLALVIEKLCQGLGLVLLVTYSNKAIFHLVPIPLLLVSCTYLFSTYSTFRVKSRPVIAIAVIDAVRLIIALVLVGWILGRELF
jgi:hypothetical protein